jgi:hypothetical protein
MSEDYIVLESQLKYLTLLSSQENTITLPNIIPYFILIVKCVHVIFLADFSPYLAFSLIIFSFELKAST